MTAPPSHLTPSQTVGPFFVDCLLRPDARRNILAGPGTAGERIRLEGRVIDGDGAGVPDALVEIWQANAEGRYAHPAAVESDFTGSGRSGTDDEGHYWFETVKPGSVPMGRDDRRMQAPHICVIVLARGLLNHLVTRLYFSDEPGTEGDPILGHVPAERRQTLLARPLISQIPRDEMEGSGVPEGEHTSPVYTWDIVLQGTGETVFFNL